MENPFVVDSDPAFQKLRSSLRDEIREVEKAFREDMKAMGHQLSPVFATELEPIMAGMPDRFIRGLLPFFIEISEMQEAMEEQRERLAMQAVSMRRSRRAIMN